MGASQSLITKMYSEYLLASKVYQSLIGSVDEEVSDDEARIIEGMQIFVKDSGKADEVKKRLKRGEDFSFGGSKAAMRKPEQILNLAGGYAKGSCERSI